jgi:hypothetical protein
MSEAVDPQSEQFMELLTDALRSGPGSPEWHQAVKMLRASNQTMDEYSLLYTARERLESGKEYRSVRPGTGFSRKVMAGIEEQSNAPAAVPSANIIALIAAAVMLVIVVIIGIFLLKGSNPDQQAIEELTSKIFGNKVLSTQFTAPAPTTNPDIPEGWVRFGEIPLAIKANELRPTTLSSSTDASAYKVGGLITAASLSATEPLEVDVLAHLIKSTDDAIVEVFISDEPITNQNAAAGRALVWQFKAGEARVFLADGSAAPHAEKLGNHRDVAMKIVLNRDTAIVDTAGQRLFAGPHLLSATQPRYVGIRFRRRAADKGDRLGILSVAIQKS